MFTGGADLSSVEALIINYDNVATGLDDAETDLAGDPAAVSVVVGPTAGVNNKIALDIANNKRFATGNQLNVAMADAGDVIQGHRITAIGVFADGSQQILLDKTL